ncbi:MAG: polysaccharide lyase [Verrucomicrobiota bacterium]
MRDLFHCRLSIGSALRLLAVSSCLTVFQPRICPGAEGERLFLESFTSGAKKTALCNRIDKHGNVSIDPTGGPDGSAAMRVVYQGNSEGSTGIRESIPLSSSVALASLSYDVKFESDFDFSRGGKLPGLAPEKPVAGGKPMHPAGWSARPMWREEGLLTSYTYHQQKPDRHGDYMRSDRILLERGRYQAVTVVVKVNSDPGKRDGYVEVHLDGVLRVAHRELEFQNAEEGAEGTESGISRIHFTTFHGGNSKSWAPKDDEGHYRNVVAWFDNVEVRKGRVIRTAPLGE